jgi:hypothetical protein
VAACCGWCPYQKGAANNATRIFLAAYTFALGALLAAAARN